MTPDEALLPTRADIIAATHIVQAHAIASPLLKLPAGDRDILVKAENLQPTGSFKIRGASVALHAFSGSSDPVTTASAGNMGRAVAHLARAAGRPCTVIVPEHAPDAKVAPMHALGATIVRVPFEEWWSIVANDDSTGFSGDFVHPFADRSVVTGNATIASELLQTGGFDVVLVPWGGGGLALGIARGLRELGSSIPVIAVETTAAAPLTAAVAAGRPVDVLQHATFVDGIGAGSVSARMWPYATEYIRDVIAVTEEEVVTAMRDLARGLHLVVEGAGATALAAARSPRFAGMRVVVIASGGNIDLSTYGALIGSSSA